MRVNEERRPAALTGLRLVTEKVASVVRALMRRLVGDRRYRPEKHYMRGPGPKVREKQRANFTTTLA